MARGVPIDSAIRARALADLEMGMTSSAVARKHGILRQTVEQWRDKTGTAVPAALQEKRLELGRRVAEFLDEGYETLTTHARLARNEEWFAKQNAADLGVYDGILYDKMAHTIGNLRGVATDEADNEVDIDDE